ncbi:MAG: DEAD/DEAH box helicase [Novosphingobium sp.]
MHGYQDRAVTHFYESDAVQAIMPMGSGKTVSAATAIRELIDDGVIRAAIINAPKRVANMVWPTEFRNWEHLAGTKVSCVLGTPEQRAAALAEDAEVYVTSRDNIKWLVEELKKLPPDHKLFDLLCIDELSRFKSPRSKLANKHLMAVRKHFRIMWGLTGTPRPNGYEDQFRPLQMLSNNGLFRPRTFDQWRQKRFMKVDADGKPSEYGHQWVVRPEHEALIIRQIASMSFTIDPAEMPELPELTVVPHWFDMPPEALARYKKMERDLLGHVNGQTYLAPSAGVASGKLEQMVQGFVYGEGGNAEVEWLHTVKFDALVDMVEDLSDSPAMIVYGFVEELRALREQYQGLAYMGAGVSDKAAEWHEEDWNADRLPLLALHPASAGHGLNLQYGSGNQMLMLNMPWSAELYDQTIRRMHRQGQKRRTFLHLLLMRDTLDEVKFDRVVGKMTDQEAFNKYIRKV